MKTGKLLQLLKKGSFVIPLYLYQLKDQFSLSLDTFLVLVYLLQKGEKFVFDPSSIASDLAYSKEEIMQYISKLTEAGYITMDTEKNDAGRLEEYLLLTPFYEKLSGLLVEEMNHEDANEEISIYEVFEREFGRPLSPMEYEIIKAWVDSNMSSSLILRALKEATYNGVSNLRYIDKILYEWGKKGFQNAEDVDEYQQNRRQERKEEPKVQKEIFHYNWFDEEDDE